MSTAHTLALFLCLAFCSADICRKQLCEYEFTVSQQFILASADVGHVWVNNGSLFYKNTKASPPDPLFHPVPDELVDTIIQGDGYPRLVTVINNQLPGPVIEVEEGATVVVHVRNDMESSAVTIHWHGLYQRGTPYMDGASMVTQCPILPGNTFTYEFIADPAGTHAYHAHHGMQRPDGLVGALIVHPKATRPQHDGKGMVVPGPRERRASMCDAEISLVLTDWNHEPSINVFIKRNMQNFYPDGFDKDPYVWTRSLDGRLVSEDPYTVLINGRGRTTLRDGTFSSVNLTTVDVAPSSRFCFRIVAGMMEKAFFLSVDQHVLTAIASDGHDFDPVEVERVIIHPGETYDVSVKTMDLASATSKGMGQPTFWVRVASLEAGEGWHTFTPKNNSNTGFGIFRYKGAPITREPISSPLACTALDPCPVLACPFPQYPPNAHRTCVFIDELSNADKADTPPDYPAGQSREHFFNFEFGPSVRRRRFLRPAAPLLTQLEDAGVVPCSDDCDFANSTVEQCICTHTLPVPLNYSVTLVLTNMGPAAFGTHPVHLHGHSFHVLKVGFGTPDPDTGVLVSQTTDITCVNDTNCARADWANGTPPPFHVDHPIRKDTVVVPAWGYAVVRLLTDNPGYWFLHCHMAHHFYWGMGLVLDEGHEHHHLFQPPPGFPKCGNFQPSSPVGRAEANLHAWERLVGGDKPQSMM